MLLRGQHQVQAVGQLQHDIIALVLSGTGVDDDGNDLEGGQDGQQVARQSHGQRLLQSLDREELQKLVERGQELSIGQVGILKGKC